MPKKLIIEDPAALRALKAIGAKDVVKAALGKWAKWRKKQWPFREMSQEEMMESALDVGPGMAGVLKPKAVAQFIKAAVKTKQPMAPYAKILEQLLATPQRELSRISKIGVKEYPTSKISARAFYTPRSREIDIDPRRVKEAADFGSLWHELVHGRQWSPEVRELKETLKLKEIADKFKGADPREWHAKEVQLRLMQEKTPLLTSKRFNRIYKEELINALNKATQFMEGPK